MASDPIDFRYTPGLNHAGSYQASGTPWLTGSTLDAVANSGSARQYKFPHIAKRVTVRVIPPSFNKVGNVSTYSDPVYVSFGELLDASGNSRDGQNTFNTQNEVGQPLPPQQCAQNHYYTLLYVSASTPGSSQIGPRYGEEQVFNVRTDHINIMSLAGATENVTSSFQIYAELTNIREERMPSDYFTGSGVNIY